MHWHVPLLLIRTAVAAVWLYEGLWCKLLNGDPNQRKIVQQVRWFGSSGVSFLLALGVYECGLGLWVLSGVRPDVAAIVQTVTLVGLNTNGILWSRKLIHDPAGMVVKNFAFLVLAWVAAS